MRRFIMLSTVMSLVFAAGLAWAQKAVVRPRQPSPVIHSQFQGIIQPFIADNNIVNVAPSTITFNANSPGSSISGNSSATVAFAKTGGSHGSWTLSVGSNASNFSGPGNCTSIPTSAVQVMCSTASVSPSGSGASASCNATSFTNLSNSLPGLQVTSGKEANDTTTKENYTVTLNYQLGDSWKYIPNTCPLTITYTANVQ